MLTLLPSVNVGLVLVLASNPDVVFVTLGTGVGGGVILDGNLIHGVGGAGGEIGHIIVEPETGV